MWLLSLVCLLLWAFGLGSAIAGTYYTLARFARRPTDSPRADDLPPVSILKPVKGIEAGLEENLRSFFELDYPRFEIIFCVADADDPCVALIHKLFREYPLVSAKLTIGAANAGHNPKVNNLIPAYDLARHDVVLISDSNVRVLPHYLLGLVECLAPDVGVVTAVVAGTHGTGLGGRLESAYLNTFATRWMQLCFAINRPFVVGKTMLFRKVVLDRFGGLRNLARYIAEDFVTGEVMRRLGYRVEIYFEPVAQHIGNHSVKAFWSRHLRWGRIRRSQCPPGFVLEPLQYAVSNGLIGAFAFGYLWDVAFWPFLSAHLVIWGAADAFLIHRMEGKLSVTALAAWFIREVIALPHWMHAASSNRILWRGNRLRILEGGLVAV